MLAAWRADLPKQLVATKRVVAFKLRMKKMMKATGGQFQVPEYFAEVVAKHGDKVAYVMNGKAMTYRELDEYSNRVARWAVEEAKLPVGATVALMAYNAPEFVGFWLGMAKAGCKAALINTNLTGKPLAHCLGLAFEGNGDGKKADVVVASPELAAVAAEVRPAAADSRPRPKPRVFCLTGDKATGGAAPLASALAALGPEGGTPVADRRTSKSCKETLFYIYTSGTTGLPKAAKISHMRFALAATAVTRIYDIGSTDKYYCALPLYHSAGGMLAVGGAWEAGIPCVLRPKFSASNFFKDCRDNDCTVAQYIGELCRYLLNTPERPGDRDHKVRMVVGNGMRPDVWTPFMERFGVAAVGEFYAATEGNANLFNFGLPCPPGAVGYLPPMLKSIYPVKFFAIDQITESLERDPKTGLCRETRPEERGECMGKITNEPDRAFEGYTNKAATQKKIARDCSKKGDSWFRTGDLLRVDKQGYVYFCDRLGDTFRWKGENVATTEVQEAITGVRGLSEVNVYGVTVPNCDGRAGMASMVVDGKPESFDFGGVYKAALELPAYARPLFLRCVPAVEITGTLKHKKVALRDQGFDPSAISDQLFFRDDTKKTYVPLDEALYRKICEGEVRV